MSSYSICSFILIAWRLAPGIIYCTLLRHDSKDRIIHFLLDCSAALLSLSEHVTNFNESLQHPRKSRVSWPPFIGRDLQHFHLSLVLTFIWIAFSSLLSRETLFSRWAKNSSPHILFAECCGWKFQETVQFEVAIPHRKLQSLRQSNKLCENTALSLQDTRATGVNLSYRSCE